MELLKGPRYQVDRELVATLEREVIAVMALVLRSEWGQYEKDRILAARKVARVLLKSHHYYGPRKVRLCSIDGCERQHAARGWCFRHWSLLHRRKRTLANEYHLANKRQTRDDLTEDEFCHFKDLRSQGFSVRDVAIDMEQHLITISKAWEFETYSAYRDRKEEAERFFNDPEDEK